MKEFFEKYRRAKFPNDVIAGNVLKALGIPEERVETAVEVLKANGKYAGIIRDTPTGPFVNLDSPGIPAPASTPGLHDVGEMANAEPPAEHTEATPVKAAPIQTSTGPTFDPKANKVFITHGKQKAIVIQIKELLVFGSFDPVVSVERESTAIPVPEKVFEDMRSCAAGVIHVGAEGKYLDSSGNEHTKINDNVLIEIGAAMALYGKKVILLVEKGVVLPSNLQGLYRCEFEGDQLNYDATMTILPLGPRRGEVGLETGNARAMWTIALLLGVNVPLWAQRADWSAYGADKGQRGAAAHCLAVEVSRFHD